MKSSVSDQMRGYEKQQFCGTQVTDVYTIHFYKEVVHKITNGKLYSLISNQTQQQYP